MSSKLTFLAVLFAVLATAAVTLPAQSQTPPGPPGLNRVRVFLELPAPAGPPEFAAIQAAGGSVRHQFLDGRVLSAEVPEPALQGLRNSPRFVSIYPVAEVSIADNLTQAWGIDQIDAERVWGGAENAVDVVAGRNAANGVRVAVIDSGIGPHPDLAVVGGYNYVSDTSNYADDHGHGTHVAGTVAALDNGIGVIGVAPHADLLALKVLAANGNGYLDDVAAAINWSRQNGADVINLSLSCNYAANCDVPALRSAVQDAAAAGIVIVAAADNVGTTDTTADNVGWPARYDEVIAVAATDANNLRASFSSTGPKVEIAAPGVGIVSTYLNNGYVSMQGTSMASPHVAGVAALLVACGNNASQVRSILQQTADDLGTTGRDNIYGYGLVDADEQASCASAPEQSCESGICEGFESGSWSGGTGWSGAWQRSGSSSYTTVVSGGAQAGVYQAQIRDEAGLTRSFDLSGYSSATLSYWARSTSFEAGDTAAVQVSGNGSSWATLRTHTDSQDDGPYQQYTFDLGGYAGGSSVSIRFLGQMSTSSDYFYVDSISISGETGGGTSNTATPTPTATNTNTPTATATPTNTGTPTLTPTSMNTNTPTPTATPTNTPNPNAGGGTVEDNFESNSWSGGTGWTGSWSRTGSSSYTSLTSGGAEGGSRQALIRGGAGITRTFSLSGYDNATLRYWAQFYSLESGDALLVQVSTNGSTWTTIRTHLDGEDDLTYRRYEFSLDAYAGASTVYLRFLNQGSNAYDYFYVDSVAISGAGSILDDSTPTNTSTATSTSTATNTPTSTNTPLPTDTPPPTNTPDRNGGGGTVEDNFESNSWNGGTGWTGNWSRTGSSSYTTLASGGAEGGSTQALIRGGAGIARTLSLSGFGNATLSYWAQFYSLESGDSLVVQISTNGSSWTTLRTYADGEDDLTYRRYEFSLDAYAGASTVYLRFLNQGSNAYDYFYVDSIAISGS